MRKDEVTQELPGVPRRRGRPPTGMAKSGSVRQAEYRERLKAQGRGVLTVEVSLDVIEALRKLVQFKDEDQGHAVDRILSAYLLRKR